MISSRSVERLSETSSPKKFAFTAIALTLLAALANGLSVADNGLNLWDRFSRPADTAPAGGVSSAPSRTPIGGNEASEAPKEGSVAMARPGDAKTAAPVPPAGSGSGNAIASAHPELRANPRSSEDQPEATEQFRTVEPVQAVEPALGSQVPMHPPGPEPIDIREPISLLSNASNAMLASASGGNVCRPRIKYSANTTGTATDALTHSGNIKCVQAPLSGEMTVVMELCGGQRRTIQSITVERRAHDQNRSRSTVGSFYYSLIDNGAETLSQPMNGGYGGMHTATFPPTYATHVRVNVRTKPQRGKAAPIYQQLCSIVVS